MSSNEKHNSIIEKLIDEFKNLLNELRPIKFKLNDIELNLFEKIDSLLKNTNSLSEKLNAYKIIGDSRLSMLIMMFSNRRDELLNVNIQTDLGFKRQCELKINTCIELINEITPFESNLTDDDLKYFEIITFIFKDPDKSKIEIYTELGEHNINFHKRKLSEIKDFIKNLE